MSLWLSALMILCSVVFLHCVHLSVNVELKWEAARHLGVLCSVYDKQCT